ncbi:MAG: hypothetical protein J6A37_01030 [Oscillospiraceae bacterium]|nr:hypothetical protein [Oscillospiraceae bacterium]
MKMYKVLTKNSGITCIYDSNRIKCIDMWNYCRPYMNEDKFIGNWIPSHFTTTSDINKNKKVYNVMRHNLMYYIVDELTKNVIEKEFSDCVQFLDAIYDEAPSTKYYLLYPYKSIDGLDMDKSDCCFKEDKTDYSYIYKYVFKRNVEYCPIFKMRCGNNVHELMVMATDKFKNFIESNNITGFDFEEVFDFDKE